MCCNRCVLNAVVTRRDPSMNDAVYVSDIRQRFGTDLN